MQYFPHSQPFPLFLYSASPLPRPGRMPKTPFVLRLPSHCSRFPAKSSRLALRGRLLEGGYLFFFSLFYFVELMSHFEA